MSFSAERERFATELDEFYRTYPVDIAAITDAMTAESEAHPEWSPYRRKALIYQTAAREIDVQVFRHCPFYYEMKSGRTRRRWGFDGIGGWMKGHGYGMEYQRAGDEWKKRGWDQFVAFNGTVDTDLDHHSLGYDTVLQIGLDGIAARARQRLARTTDEKQGEFLRSVLLGCEALSAIAEKFGERAAQLLEHETDPVVVARLRRIAECAPRVPAQPPETFFEALNTLLFMRECIGSLEGMGVSTFGHMDRLLNPYYEADLAAGRISEDEALDLLQAFLAIADVKFETHLGRHETSTTVVIGGCDAAGTPVCNDVTRLIVESYRRLRLVNPKFHARVSPHHPTAYFDLLADFIAAGTNVMAVYNDEVVIRANVRSGKAIEDARLYVGGGCQENVLQNCEISSRATMFLSLLAVFEMGLFPERWQAFAQAENLPIGSFVDCTSFDDLYAVFLHNLGTVVDRLAANRTRLEQEGWRFNPCPMLSSTLDDCIEDARDMTEGGCRYSTGSVDLVGIGTIVDSLYAIREAVFERHAVSLAELRDILAADFAGEESLRQYLVNRVPKYGRDEGEIRDFATQVFADAARVASGQPNSRGGRYVASLFAHMSSIRYGQQGGATPDGRKAGEPLSKSMGPSTTALGSRHDLGSVLDALEPLDLTDYPVVAVLDVKLPLVPPRQARQVIKPIIQRFLQIGGSVLQVNTLDAETLRDARRDPDNHRDVVVRVSGFSAYFTTLPGNQQDEIIQRTQFA